MHKPDRLYRNRALALVRQVRRWRAAERGVERNWIIARELLTDAYYQLDPIYLDDGVTLHPGNVSTIHDLHAYLWPKGKPTNAQA